MRETRAAIRYAKAVLNLALDLKKADKVNEDMQLIASTVEENKELQILLVSPVYKVKVKKAALSELFEKKVSEISFGLINQLMENKRLPLLAEVAKQYTIIYDHYKGTEIAKVTSAIPLTDDLKTKVLKKVKDILGKEVHLENIVDPSIIGGFILKVGDKQFDASILGKMNNLRREFEDNLYVPKF
ncbi:MAG: ATP synthase F1 subunit delta [Flavobacteriaceae bacterium]|jgi:F-type H+-transporting ATPase subunit delta|nr:ATP synthase F1 subunit delta [Flavobacteriaceae bacterium]MCB0485977.1 ATP synthase F1 subunit delta [Flavobacteriaceae bacterium]